MKRRTASPPRQPGGVLMAACTGVIAMDAFRFSPELFEHRTDIISKLQEHGFDWLTHYGSVDPLHNVFGMEVCGIREKEDAVANLKVLTEMYPSWRARQPWYHEGSRDPGWRAQIQRDSEPPPQQWQSAD